MYALSKPIIPEKLKKIVQWIKTFYCNRTSYISNNGFRSNIICMERGIFLGCPISPLLFLCAIEVLAISIRNNENIRGIKVGGVEKKISLLADDTTCFLQGDLDSFKNLFETLNSFASLSGCKTSGSGTTSLAWTYMKVCGYSDSFCKNLNQRSVTPRWPLTPHLLRSYMWLYPRIIVSKSHENTLKYVDTLTFFAKTWSKSHWPLDDLWPHICWGHMCDSTQGSLCPSPMKIHQCMWIQWPFWQKIEPKVGDP